MCSSTLSLAGRFTVYSVRQGLSKYSFFTSKERSGQSAPPSFFITLFAAYAANALGRAELELYESGYGRGPGDFVPCGARAGALPLHPTAFEKAGETFIATHERKKGIVWTTEKK